jgi:serine/threonine protein kinase
MGEVYRARDTKLQRDVALKILPDVMARDAQRMARFEREAQVLASLNHSNIASIYGLEESDGIRALVMELVEGETLAERLGRGAGAARPRSGSVSGSSGLGTGTVQRDAPQRSVSTEDALPIARQIAEALEYAHERGVIHRDLKPANVKITPEGTVKVLDFGLAKVLDPQDSSATMDVGNSPTLSAMATQAGVILGTAAYMSPEQAKGQRVDRRADIWAFGVVLYEMLSGRKAFDGETISDVLAAVIRAEPEWTSLPEATPPAVQNLIRRCLIKDPKQRLRDIGDARIAIDETISGTMVSPVETHGQEAHTTTGAQAGSTYRRSLLQLVLPWVTIATTLGMVAFAVVYFTRSQVSPSTVRALISAPEKVTFTFDGSSGGPVLSPDGKRLVFPATDSSGKQALWVRPMDSLTAQRLEGTDGATYPFWSPDSHYLGFFQDGKLKKIDVTGGPPVLLCDAPDARGGAWSNKGVIVFAPQVLAGGLSSVPAAGGMPSPVATHKGSGGAYSNRWPEFLPDGKHFLYLSGDLSAPGTNKLGVYVGAVGTNEEKFLLQADSDALYAPPGYLLFLRGDTLMAQRFDAGSQKLEGEVFPVAEHVGSPSQFRLGLFSVSRTGLLIFTSSGAGSTGGQLVWVDANGKEMNKVGPPGVFFPRLSPDGKRAAYGATAGSGSPNLWLMDLERGVQTRFTFNSGGDIGPVWSPDSTRVVYTSVRKGNYDLYVKNASGAGSANLLLHSDDLKIPSDWSRDGRYIAYDQQDSKGKTKYDLWVVPLNGDHKPFAYLQTPFNEGTGMFSPDGHWMAYESDQSGRSEIYLSPFPAGGSKWQVSQGGGVQPIWSRDGSKLYYVSPGGKLMVASIKENGPAVAIGTPQELFQIQLQDPTAGGQSYAVAPDGKRFLVDQAGQGASPPLTLVTNWTEIVKNQ